MRKFVLAGLAMVLTVGLTLAADVVFLGYDKEKKELKVKEDDKEKTYKVTDKVKFKSGEKDMDAEKGIARLEKSDASERAKGKAKLSITVEGGELKEVKFPMGKGKGKDKN